MWLFSLFVNGIIISRGVDMATYDFEKLQDMVSVINKDELYTTICKNIKKFRLQRYNEFKNKNIQNTINPFSSENIAALLDYNHNHYKRFESENDSTKMIPLDKIVKLSIILDKKIDDFIKN